MNTRRILHLIFAALVLSACSQLVTASQESRETSNANVEPPAVFTDSETGQIVTARCSKSSDEVLLLIDSVQGYCLQYPAEYDLFRPNESEIILFKRSVLNANEPRVSITVQPAGDVTLKEAADEIAQGYAIPGTEPIRESLTMDGEAAIMLGGLSGQDPNRQVVVRHNDQLVHLFFIEFNKSDPEYARSETLYNTVIQSFNFHPDSNACPGCPLGPDPTPQVLESTPVQTSVNDTAELFSSDQLGLCFSYPQGYTQIPDAGAVEVAAPDLPGSDVKGLFWLEISDSYNRTAEEIADQDLTYAPGLSVGRWTVTLGGEQAVVLDGMPGQELQRRVYVVHQQTLYVLAFWPARSENKAAGDQMEALYAAITNSWAWSPCSASE